ncbi:MAG: outer membrane beta-barrel protein [Opitutaceae bacterium]
MRKCPKLNSLKIALLPLCFGLHHQVSAGYRFNHGTLIGNFNSQLEATDNSNSSADKQEDIIMRIGSNLTYASQGAVVQTRISGGVRLVRYSQRERNNGEDLNLDIASSFPTGVRSNYFVSLKAGVNEDTSANSEFGRVTRTRNYDASIASSYDFINRYSISGDLEYSLQQGLSDGQNNTESWSIPLTFSYRYSEALSYGLGYRVRHETSKGTIDPSKSWDHAVFANFNGDLLPTLTGSLRAGAQIRFGEEENSISPYVSGNLNWNVSPLTNIGISLSADFGTSLGNQSTQSYQLSGNLNHSFEATLNGICKASIQRKEYGVTSSQGSNRSENEWELSVGLAKKIGEHVSSSVLLAYTKSTSTLDTANYDETSLNLNLSFPF